MATTMPFLHARARTVCYGSAQTCGLRLRLRAQCMRGGSTLAHSLRVNRSADEQRRTGAHVQVKSPPSVTTPDAFVEQHSMAMRCAEVPKCAAKRPPSPPPSRSQHASRCSHAARASSCVSVGTRSALPPAPPMSRIGSATAARAASRNSTCTPAATRASPRSRRAAAPCSAREKRRLPERCSETGPCGLHTARAVQHLSRTLAKHSGHASSLTWCGSLLERRTVWQPTAHQRCQR